MAKQLLYWPQMNTDKHGFEKLTDQVLASVFEVSNALGAGFLEKVYERAMLTEIRLRGLEAKTQAPFAVTYKGYKVGDYLADIVVENTVIVELKCVDHLANEHVAQCINYLKASGLAVCLLVNFQRPKVEWKRILLDNPK